MASPLPKYEAEVLKAYADTLEHGQATLAEGYDVTRITMSRWLNQWCGCPRKDELVALARKLLITHPEFAPAKDDTVRYYKELHGCDTATAEIIASALSPSM